MTWSACRARLEPPRYAGKSPATPSTTPAPSSAAATIAGALPLSTGAARRPAGTIVPGASMLANRVHAADQPSGVSGHLSSGWVRGAPDIQMP